MLWVLCIELPLATTAMHFFLGAVVPVGAAITFSFYWTTVPLLVFAIAAFILIHLDIKRKEKIREECKKELKL
jgi:hypothetical protein